MTAIGDTAVLLRFDGAVLAVGPDRVAVELDVAPPVSNLAAYLEVAERPEYANFNHGPEVFRYNDLLYVDSAEDQSLLASYNYFDPENICYRSRVAKARLDGPLTGLADLQSLNLQEEDWTVLFETTPCLPFNGIDRAIPGHTAGGRLAFDGDRTIYMSPGDYLFDGVLGPETVPGGTLPTSQDPGNDYGKVLKIDLISGESTRMTLGHRNTQGIAFDPQGNLWIAEHGMRGGDEFNLIEAGKNYGWPLETYGTRYSTLPMPLTDRMGRHERFEKPKLALLPSVALSSLISVKPGFHPTWDGDLLAGSLRGAALFRVRHSDGDVIFAEVIEIKKRIRHLVQVDSGEIVLWTDSNEIIFLTPAEGGSEALYVERHIAALEAEEPHKQVLQSAFNGCIECHALSPGNDANAPSLAAVFGADIASTGFSDYSAALRRADGVWTAERLQAFLTDPDGTMPGTIMPAPNLSETITTDIVGILEGLAKAPEMP
jgi:cytochrome c2